MVNGSPQIVVDRRYRQARRIVFECANGPIPDGKHPVMKCRNARCLNAEHMRALTTKQIGQLASKEGKFSSPSRRAAIALAKRAKSKKLDAARVEDIKAARTAREAAEKHNIHQSLAARELYRAQGFPESYLIDRGADGRTFSKAAQVRMCGNSVCPPVAAALVRANFVDAHLRRAAA